VLQANKCLPYLCVHITSLTLTHQDVETEHTAAVATASQSDTATDYTAAGSTILSGSAHDSSTSNTTTNTSTSNSSSTTSSSNSRSNPIAAMRSLRSSARDVQSTVSSVLDTAEAAKNLLNWTHPQKTALIAAVIALLWGFLLVVPGRYILLIGGLFAFGEKWLLPSSSSTSSSSSSAGATAAAAKTAAADAWLVKAMNFIASVPTDADLRRCYR
jgi:hypothetical protein